VNAASTARWRSADVERMRECGSSLALWARVSVTGRDNRAATARSSGMHVTRASRDSNPRHAPLPDNPRLAARHRLRCSAGKGAARDLAPCQIVQGYGTRTGGSRTRISVSCVRAVRPSSGIGTSRGDTVLSVALLSYGIRLRAAFAHARRSTNSLEEPARFELATVRSGNPRCLRPVNGQELNGEGCLPLYRLSYGSSREMLELASQPRVRDATDSTC
jgi:hypothetical protein